jgi:hypothetical protein
MENQPGNPAITDHAVSNSNSSSSSFINKSESGNNADIAVNNGYSGSSDNVVYTCKTEYADNTAKAAKALNTDCIDNADYVDNAHNYGYTSNAGYSSSPGNTSYVSNGGYAGYGPGQDSSFRSYGPAVHHYGYSPEGHSNGLRNPGHGNPDSAMTFGGVSSSPPRCGNNAEYGDFSHPNGRQSRSTKALLKYSLLTLVTNRLHLSRLFGRIG